MGIRKSVLMLSNTNTQWNVVGEKIRANAYYGYSDALCTVQVIYQNFVGGCGIQGTLSTNPTEEDWFWININPFTGSTSPFIVFPIDMYSPTGSNGGDTGSRAFTFVGNFVYLRAVVTRDYISPSVGIVAPSWQNWTYGQVDKVLLSL